MQENQQKKYFIEDDLQIYENPSLDLERYYTLSCLKQKDIKKIKQFLKKKGNNGVIQFLTYTRNNRKYTKFDCIKQLDSKFIKSGECFKIKKEDNVKHPIKKKVRREDNRKAKLLNKNSNKEDIDLNEAEKHLPQQEQKQQPNQQYSPIKEEIPKFNDDDNINSNKDYFGTIFNEKQYLEWKPYEDRILKEQKYHSKAYRLLVYYKTKPEVVKRIQHILA